MTGRTRVRPNKTLRRASGLLEQTDAPESRSRAFWQWTISRRDRVILNVIRLRLPRTQHEVAVPDFQTLMLPLLSHVADGNEHTIAASRDILADQFNLTEEERKQRLPSGAANTFYNRLAWAKTYLERAELITKIKRGVFVISPRGREVLADRPDRITSIQGVRSQIGNLEEEKGSGAKLEEEKRRRKRGQEPNWQSG